MQHIIFALSRSRIGSKRIRVGFSPFVTKKKESKCNNLKQSERKVNKKDTKTIKKQFCTKWFFELGKGVILSNVVPSK